MKQMFVTVFLFFMAANLRAESVLLFLGDSLSAGYGLNEEEAYPALIQKKISEEKLPWRVVNAGVSGDTTQGGLARLSWALKASPKIVVVALGANDGLRGVDAQVTEKNLNAIVSELQKKKIRVILCGMKLPTNYGREYNQRFAAVFPAVAKKHNVPLYPFLLEGVGGIPALNQADGVHPTAEGQKILAERLYPFLRPYLKAP